MKSTVHAHVVLRTLTFVFLNSLHVFIIEPSLSLPLSIAKYEFLINGEGEREVNTFLSEDHTLEEYKTVSKPLHHTIQMYNTCNGGGGGHL